MPHAIVGVVLVAHGLITTMIGFGSMFLWQHHVMSDLGTYGWASSGAFSINNAGDVAGWVDDRGGGASQGFLSRDGAITEVGATRSYAYAVNDRRQVVGWNWIASQPSLGARAYSWRDGATTDLGAVAGAWTQAYAVNDCGQVVGSSGAAPNDDQAILWATDLP